MNILSCLTPKNGVDYVKDDASLFKTLQLMQKNNRSAIPIINEKGRYVGTITAGDILGCIAENFNLSLKESAKFPLRNIKRTRDYKGIGVNAPFEELLALALDQNFVPVMDDDDNFIGILTRKEIIMWMHEQYTNEHPKGGK